MQEDGNLGCFYGENSGVILEKCCHGTSSSSDTFVEEMLARDMEMRLPFPEIFDENYDY